MMAWRMVMAMSQLNIENVSNEYGGNDMKAISK
jgi:hypothetical protein